MNNSKSNTFKTFMLQFMNLDSLYHQHTDHFSQGT